MSSSYEEVMASKNFSPFHLDHLTPQMIQKAKEELNEDENTVSTSIEQLRTLIIKEKHLTCRTDNEFLLQFLRARKFIVKNAFSRLQTMYQTASKAFADVYTNIDVEKVKTGFTCGFGGLLPYRDREGAAVALFQMNNWKPEDVDVLSFMSCMTAVLLSAVDEPATQVCGLQILVDCRGTTFQHLRNLSPRFLYLTSKGLRDTLPIRYTGVHIINASAISRAIWAVINIFLSEKLRKRVHFHDESMESLHKFVPKEILPKEYGGDNPNFDPVEWGRRQMEIFLSKYLRIIRDGYLKN